MKKRMIRHLAVFGPAVLSAAAALACGPMSAQAQIAYTTPGLPYTENFDTLTTNSVAHVTLGNNGQIPNLLGWYSKVDSSRSPIYFADNGNSNTGALYSYGAAGSTNRALGSLAAASVSSSPLYVTFGARIVNSTGSTLTSADISFDQEQWRYGGNGNADVTGFYYKIFNAGKGNLGADTYAGIGPIGSTGTVVDPTWTSFSPFNLVAGTGSVTAGGTAPISTTTKSGTLSNLNLANGQELWIRWLDPNDLGADSGMAVDNFSFNGHTSAVAATPAPSALLPLALGVPMIAFRLRRRRK